MIKFITLFPSVVGFKTPLYLYSFVSFLFSAYSHVQPFLVQPIGLGDMILLSYLLLDAISRNSTIYFIHRLTLILSSFLVRCSLPCQFVNLMIEFLLGLLIPLDTPSTSFVLVIRSIALLMFL